MVLKAEMYISAFPRTRRDRYEQVRVLQEGRCCSCINFLVDVLKADELNDFFVAEREMRKGFFAEETR